MPDTIPAHIHPAGIPLEVDAPPAITEEYNIQPASEGSSDEEDTAALNSRFTDAQLEYLNGRKDEYSLTPRKKKPEVAHHAARELIHRIESTGRVVTSTEKTALCKVDKTGKVVWTGRQLFYKENSEIVAATQQRLYKEAVGSAPDPEQIAATRVDVLDADEDDEGDKPVPSTSKSLTMFHFFQKALTEEWNGLSDGQHAQYNEKARLWSKKGPTLDEKRKLAEKESAVLIRRLSKTLYTQMDLKMVSLIGDNSRSAAMIDSNGNQGTGVSFKRDCRDDIDASDIINIWGRWCAGNFADEESNPPKRSRRRGLPLLHFDRNAYGEPILKSPAICVPPGQVPWLYLPRVLRNFLTISYALASGEDEDNTVVPWSDLVKHPKDFVDAEYIPNEDMLKMLFRDPGDIGKDNVQRILDHLYARQVAGGITFEFKSYAGKKGSVIARKPRMLVEHDDGSPPGEKDASPSLAPGYSSPPSPKVAEQSSNSKLSSRHAGNAKPSSSTDRRSNITRRNIVLSEESDDDSLKIRVQAADSLSPPKLTNLPSDSKPLVLDDALPAAPIPVGPTPLALDSLDPTLRETFLHEALLRIQHELGMGSNTTPKTEGDVAVENEPALEVDAVAETPMPKTRATVKRTKKQNELDLLTSEAERFKTSRPRRVPKVKARVT
ncbi:hypothetical protein EST38_g7894 [Candolleomyces aberdarensis]|uniref:Uncharacterized protein n=1 Tax=Candolleomyces aberdarensis TaxID=2316362 RepID=A0A4Q2DDZ5_9AGAR|nr:hypothetical protein EST38_g7894 [Candolleomyces aberdarensis]